MTSLTRERLLALADDLKDRRVLSVYVGGTSPDPSGQQWRVVLDHALEAARRHAALDHEGRIQFDRAVHRLEQQLASRTAGLGACGWMGFIGPDEVYFVTDCPVHLPTMVVWDIGAHIAPGTRAIVSSRSSVLALIDARRVEIFSYTDGRLGRVDEIHAHHDRGPSAHLGDAALPGFHVGTRGGTGRDRLQRMLREGTARMQREAVEIALERAGSEGDIFVAGTPKQRRGLVKRLSLAASGRVLELASVDIHAPAAMLVAAIEEGVSQLRRRRIERDVMSVIDTAAARGAAAVGPGTTRWALDQQRVQRLFLTPRFIDEHPSLAELAVRDALAQQADVDLVSDDGAAQLEVYGGIAARLRYRLV